ncbi:leucine-rich repeat protein [Apilactobacillus sp. M161]|uniref:Leucine-rich repeat protein n=1 Tax=Apilactobacillus xinyiensis TaxID=2841032 RepID=A0ABT0I391_9LACO|nr:leucine-rich repeat protein [Apilactobacillus xinyiensis]MCK8625166.1 leucine-rich repeat protein [Apilactobacillus xinyiensis]
MNKKLLLTISVSFLALGAGTLNCNAEPKNSLNAINNKELIRSFTDSHGNNFYVNEAGTVVKSDIKNTNTVVMASDMCIKRISNEAFKNKGLENISIPVGVKEIDNNAFEGNNIRSVILPSSVEKVGNSILGPASKDKTIELTNLDEDLHKKLLQDDEYSIEHSKCNLKNISENSDNLRSFTDSHGNTIYVNEDGTVVKSDIKNTNTVVMASDMCIKRISNEAFKNKGLENISIPVGVQEIDNNAFEGNNIRSVILPSSVEKVGNSILGPASKDKTIELTNLDEDLHKKLLKDNEYSIKHLTCNPDDKNSNIDNNTEHHKDKNIKSDDKFINKETSNEYNRRFDFNHDGLNFNTLPIDTNSKETVSKASDKKNNDNPSLDDKNISKNKDIFHKYTRPFSIINKRGKTYKANNFIKNGKQNFILINGKILNGTKYERTYQQESNVKKVKIINHGGINMYRNINFSKQNFVKHAKFNQKFKVIAVKHLNYDITRYKLSNGLFITTHKNFVKVIK